MEKNEEQSGKRELGRTPTHSQKHSNDEDTPTLDTSPGNEEAQVQGNPTHSCPLNDEQALDPLPSPENEENNDQEHPNCWIGVQIYSHLKIYCVLSV